VGEGYWHNPDLNGVQLFGKDVRALLALSCQKLFYEEGHPGYYHYGPLEQPSTSAYGRQALHLPTSPYISLHLPTSPYISLYLPYTSPYISPVSPRQEMDLAVGSSVGEVAASVRRERRGTPSCSHLPAPPRTSLPR